MSHSTCNGVCDILGLTTAENMRDVEFLPRRSGASRCRSEEDEEERMGANGGYLSRSSSPAWHTDMAYSCPRQHKLAVEPRLDSRFRLAPATRLDALSTNHLDADPFLGLRGRWCTALFPRLRSISIKLELYNQDLILSTYIERQYSCHL